MPPNNDMPNPVTPMNIDTSTLAMSPTNDTLKLVTPMDTDASNLVMHLNHDMSSNESPITELPSTLLERPEDPQEHLRLILIPSLGCSDCLSGLRREIWKMSLASMGMSSALLSFMTSE